METVTETHELKDRLKFNPVQGVPNLYVMHWKDTSPSAGEEMTKEDWDKFEQDITDAFEQVP